MSEDSNADLALITRQLSLLIEQVAFMRTEMNAMMAAVRELDATVLDVAREIRAMRP